MEPGIGTFFGGVCVVHAGEGAGPLSAQARHAEHNPNEIPATNLSLSMPVSRSHVAQAGLQLCS